MKYEELPRDEAGAIKPRQAAFPIEVDLVTSIEVSGATVSALSVREPTVGDIEVVNKERTGLARMLRMITLIADIPPEDLRRMGSRDYVRVQELLESFL